MAKKKNTVSPMGVALIVALIVLQVYGVYFLVQKMREKKSVNNPPNPAPNPNVGNGGGSGNIGNDNTPVITYVLQQGSRGNDVEFLQKYLNWKIDAGLKEDGIWGRLTEAAVKKANLPSRISEVKLNELKKEYDDRSIFDNVFDWFSVQKKPQESIKEVPKPTKKTQSATKGRAIQSPQLLIPRVGFGLPRPMSIQGVKALN